MLKRGFPTRGDDDFNIQIESGIGSNGRISGPKAAILAV